MSGVPKDSVLRPCLFLAHINDLPDSLKSRARLFADDTIVYLTITSESDAQTLQDDLLKLEQWESDWSMEFNPEKMLRGSCNQKERSKNQSSFHIRFTTSN